MIFFIVALTSILVNSSYIIVIQSINIAYYMLTSYMFY